MVIISFTLCSVFNHILSHVHYPENTVRLQIKHKKEAFSLCLSAPSISPVFHLIHLLHELQMIWALQVVASLHGRSLARLRSPSLPPAAASARRRRRGVSAAPADPAWPRSLRGCRPALAGTAAGVGGRGRGAGSASSAAPPPP